MTLLPRERAALDDFCRWVRGRFGDRVCDVALFGSRARGEGDEDSDLDVVVTVRGLTGREAHEIGQESGEAMTHHAVRLAPFALSEERMQTLRDRERLIAMEIDRDRVAL